MLPPWLVALVQHHDAYRRREQRRGGRGVYHGDKTHCPAGHPYSAENTRLYQGRRYCKECSRRHGREYRRRRSAA